MRSPIWYSVDCLCFAYAIIIIFFITSKCWCLRGACESIVRIRCGRSDRCACVFLFDLCIIDR